MHLKKEKKNKTKVKPKCTANRSATPTELPYNSRFDEAPSTHTGKYIDCSENTIRHCANTPSSQFYTFALICCVHWKCLVSLAIFHRNNIAICHYCHVFSSSSRTRTNSIQLHGCQTREHIKLTLNKRSFKRIVPNERDK